MWKLLDKDHYLTGTVIAILLPVITAILVIPAGRLILASSDSLTFFDSNIFLLLLIPNLLVMRYLLVKKQKEKSGRAILLLTLTWVILYFVFAHRQPFNFPI